MVGGCSTGYGVAVLARIAKRVVGVEPHQALADQARAALTREAITNAVIVSGTVADGSPAEAPFDGILLEGAVPELPKTLLDQLKDGGRLVAVLADGRVMKAVVAVRSGPSFDTRALFDAAAAPLPGFERAQVFTF
jgi:protein-L-isoaspartate(D-aspartate) O-methyltransferase